MTLIPSLTFIELEVVYMEYLQWVWHASWERLPPGTWFRPFLGLSYAPIVETIFLELAVSFVDTAISRFCCQNQGCGWSVYHQDTEKYHWAYLQSIIVL